MFLKVGTANLVPSKNTLTNMEMEEPVAFPLQLKIISLNLFIHAFILCHRHWIRCFEFPKYLGLSGKFTMICLELKV